MLLLHLLFSYLEHNLFQKRTRQQQMFPWRCILVRSTNTSNSENPLTLTLNLLSPKFCFTVQVFFLLSLVLIIKRRFCCWENPKNLFCARTFNWQSTSEQLQLFYCVILLKFDLVLTGTATWTVQFKRKDVRNESRVKISWKESKWDGEDLHVTICWEKVAKSRRHGHNDANRRANLYFWSKTNSTNTEIHENETAHL